MSDLQRAIDYLMAQIHNHLLAEKEDGSDEYYVSNSEREAASMLSIALTALRWMQNRNTEQVKEGGE